MEETTNHQENESDSISSSSSGVSLSEEEAARLTAIFRPVLDILLPKNETNGSLGATQEEISIDENGIGNVIDDKDATASDEEEHKDYEQQLVEFFWSTKVKTLEDLKTLEECSCWEELDDFPVFEKVDSLSSHIETVADYVLFYGGDSLLARISSVQGKFSMKAKRGQETNTDNAETFVNRQCAISAQVLEELYFYWRCRDDKKLMNYLSWVPENLEGRSLDFARQCLTHIFRKTCPWDFKSWENHIRYFKIAKGALPILEDYPQLAAEKFKCYTGLGNKKANWHPYFILLFSGLCDAWGSKVLGVRNSHSFLWTR